MSEQQAPTVTLYKCVDQNMRSAHGAEYPVGATVVDDLYENHAGCGNGLHFWPSVEIAKCKTNSYGHIIIECEVDLATLVPIGDKCKARSCFVTRIVENNYPYDAS